MMGKGGLIIKHQVFSEYIDAKEPKTMTFLHIYWFYGHTKLFWKLLKSSAVMAADAQI